MYCTCCCCCYQGQHGKFRRSSLAKLVDLTKDKRCRQEPPHKHARLTPHTQRECRLAHVYLGVLRRGIVLLTLRDRISLHTSQKER